MKRFLLSFLLFLSLGGIAIAQENPCPTITNIKTNNVGTPTNGICQATVSFNGRGDVGAEKGTQVQVRCGGTLILTQCFIISPDGITRTYTTNVFSCPCSASITITITRFTASNGRCQGGTCGNTIEIAPTPLPVKFKSFTASRSKEKVTIKWETASESNNKGFNVQRKTKGEWENVAFVFSAAKDGNSTSDLSYSFNDLNNEKGISQYRILQFDFDGRAKASETRLVRGEAMAAKLLVYPNPSIDGKVSVVFDDGGAVRNILVSDMSGRIVKQYRNISTNNLSIDGLENGVYSIQVFDLSSAGVSVDKIVIKRR